MRSRPLLSLIAALLPACTPPAETKVASEALQAPVPDQPNYFPLARGNTWVHQYTFNGLGYEVVTEVVRIEENGPRKTVTLSTRLGAGRTPKSETLIVDDTGIYQLRFSDIDLGRPVADLKYPVRPGTNWTDRYTADGRDYTFAGEIGEAEEVEVPAGKFRAVPVRYAFTTPDKTIDIRRWYAAGIGQVKTTASVGGVESVRIELKRFTPAN